MELCKKHPRYKAKRKPKVVCATCWAIYKETHPRLNLKNYVQKVLRETQE